MRWIPNRTWWFSLRRPGFMVIVRVFSERGRPFKWGCTLKVTKPSSGQSKHLNCHLQGKILIFLVMVFSINFHHWQYYLWAVKSFNLVLACCTCILIALLRGRLLTIHPWIHGHTHTYTLWYQWKDGQFAFGTSVSHQNSWPYLKGAICKLWP